MRCSRKCISRIPRAYRTAPCTSDRVMIVYVSTLAPEHYRIDLPEIERPADASEREERILVSALILTRLRS
jgi:hypothetical protein